MTNVLPARSRVNDRRLLARFALAGLVVTLAMGTAPRVEAVSFSIGTNFKGTDLNDAFGLSSGRIPPDTMGAVGPNHVAELINTSFAVYDKSGTLQNRVSLDSFWNTAFSNAGTVATASFSFDPRILYDKHSNRWFAAAVDLRDSANSRVHIGVTTGSDPSLANWRGFVIDADSAGTRWADFPTVGLDATGFYVSNNMFSNTGGGLLTRVTLVGVPKSSLTGGVPSIAGFRVEELIDPNNTGFAFQPAVDLDNSASPLSGLSRFNNTNRKRTIIPGDWITGGSNIPPQAAGDFIAQAISDPPDGNQPAPGPDTIETNDARFSGNVVLQNGSLWGVQTIGQGGRAALRWYEIDDATNNLLQTGVISDPTLDLYYPSIAVNNFGDVVIGFSGSSDATPVSTYAAVGETVLGTTSFAPIVQTHLGNGTYNRLDTANRNRWGDYSATVIDPTNEKTFWTFQEYVDGNNNWAIRATEINITSSPGGGGVIPEPSTLTLALFGLLAMVARRQRRVR